MDVPHLSVHVLNVCDAVHGPKSSVDTSVHFVYEGIFTEELSGPERDVPMWPAVLITPLGNFHTANFAVVRVGRKSLPTLLQL